MELSFPARAFAIRRATARLCIRLGWAPLHEVALPNGRRALLHRFALLAAGRLATLEDPGGVADIRAALNAE